MELYKKKRIRKELKQKLSGTGGYQWMLAGTNSKELENLAGAKSNCPHALADGNWQICIREQTLEFSLTMYTHT